MGLVREEHPCYVPTCDGCGEGDNSEYGGSFHYPTEAVAKESLRDSEWVELPDGRWLCFTCFDEERGKHPCPHGGPCRGTCGDDVCWPTATATPRQDGGQHG